MRAVLANTEYFLHDSVSGLYTARRLKTVCLFVCLFVCLGFSSHSRIFHSYGDFVTITGERLQVLTYARHSWPSNSWGIAYHANCDTVHPFIMTISEDPCYLHLLQGENPDLSNAMRTLYQLSHCNGIVFRIKQPNFTGLSDVTAKTESHA